VDDTDANQAEIVHRQAHTDRAKNLHAAVEMLVIDILMNAPRLRSQAELLLGSNAGAPIVAKFRITNNKPSVAIAVERPDGSQLHVTSLQIPTDHGQSCECPACLQRLERRFPGFGDWRRSRIADE